MAYDLRHEPWIPWRRRSGAVTWGPPEMLLDDLAGDCVVDVATPRPDFDGALQEFLIGLLTVALLPRDDDEWERLAERPPTSVELRVALDQLPPAFDLEGDGPRFFQDLSAADVAQGECWAVESLLIGMPNTKFADAGKRAVVHDLFVKPGRIQRLCRPSAAMAVLTMQTYALAGGSGHRVSLRGGGPLTTLVDPRVDAAGDTLAYVRPLWEKLWANVETWESLREAPSSVPVDSIEQAFPWLHPTRTSNPKAEGLETPPSATHPLEAYFGLPRRLRLNFGEAGRCDLTGRTDDRSVVGYFMRTHGTSYVGWQHPLSPHWRKKLSDSWRPFSGRKGAGWGDWYGLSLAHPANDHQKPAACVAAYAGRIGPRQFTRARVHVFGFNVEPGQQKIYAWIDSEIPLFFPADKECSLLLRVLADQLAAGTQHVATTVLNGVMDALFPKRSSHASSTKTSGDDNDRTKKRKAINDVQAELWTATEAEFYQCLGRLAEGRDGDSAAAIADELRSAFAGVLRNEALAVFDRWCPTPGLAPEPLRRRVMARYDLINTLDGYSKPGEQLFTALGIPLPGGGHAARAARKRTRTEATT